MPLTVDALRAALRRIGSDAPVRFDEVTRSTQETAAELAAAGAPEWTLVAAGHQTAGRGRLGRTWLDAPGALLFSLVLRPAVPPERAALLTLLAGAAMAETLGGLAGTAVGCRWPNDLLVDGAKIGGILATSSLVDGEIEHVVLGIGVNLGSAPTGVPDAGALEGVDAAEALGAFLERFAEGYGRAGSGLGPSVLERYRPLCTTLGRPVRARTVGGELVEGVAEDVDELGGLLVRTPAGRRTVRFGEVEHLDALPGTAERG
ncbi:Bifunctional ligase/repressor BirA [bacterium HR12]|nr:Bifunctional ligase/repressor BirA [bacterium HR12]